MKPRMVVVRGPVGVNCSARSGHVVGAVPAAPGGGKCRGIMSRVDLSRLEESLGHEGFECDTCHRRVKYVAPSPVDAVANALAKGVRKSRKVAS